MSAFSDFVAKMGLVSHSGGKHAKVLFAEWMGHHPGHDPKSITKWDMDFKFDTNTYILAGTLPSGAIKTVEVTKDVVEDQLDTPLHTKFAKPNPPKWNQTDTTFVEPRCEAFAKEAFGSTDHKKPVLSLVGSKGKLIVSSYAGNCPSCGVNFAKKTVVFFGTPQIALAKPEAYHPGCFMKELAYATIVGTHGSSTNTNPEPGAMRYALLSMGRTADEMRWRRRAKATCNVSVHDLAGGQDPTIPERHEWRCKCKVAPWNLTKAQRAITREEYGVQK